MKLAKKLYISSLALMSKMPKRIFSLELYREKCASNKNYGSPGQVRDIIFNSIILLKITSSV